MDAATQSSEARFEAYVEQLLPALGHADRAQPFHNYCAGLLMPGERKSVEPMAAIVAPARASAEHQSLIHFVAQAPGSDAVMLSKVRELALPAIEQQGGPIEAWIVDDTGFPKKGKHSVGVARQYCGRLGKVDNCQIAVSLSVANHEASLPIAFRLYLPQEWTDDATRRQRAHVPDDVAFKTKPQIALEQIRAARDADVAQGVVLADAAYGTNDEFRAGLSDIGLRYAVGVQSNVSVWPPGVEPLAPKEWSGRGRPPTRLRRDAQHKPSSLKQLAMSLPAEAWKDVTWRDGSNDALASRFAAVRVRPGAEDFRQAEPNEFEWLLIEWPSGEAEPSKYWLSNLPEDMPLDALVDIAKLRWRIERDYEELKSEVGLDHFEGRSWRGFHHHAALCVAAYGFLIRERAALPLPPSASESLEEPSVSDRDRPRCAANPPRAPRRKLDRHNEAKAQRRARQKAPTMSVLPVNRIREPLSSPYVTQ